MPPYLHVNTPVARLQISIPSRQRICGMTPDLQISIPPRRYTCIASPFLHTYTCNVSRPPDLHTSTSTHLQRDSRPPDLPTSTSTHLRYDSDLQISIPLRRYTCIASPYLSLHPQRDFRPPDLRTSMSLHLQHEYKSPYLRVSRPPDLHTATLTA